mgnify:CR=1 FL=1
MDSHEKTINKGKYEISQVADRLGIRPREDITGAAHRLYKLAVQRNFTRGRRTQQVAGACLYIVCRQESRPYMLIDFSDVVQTNVYVLGAVFLQLCRLLRLEQHPLISKPIDPSLFIHRFADKLNLGRRMHAVANTALRLVASMKRDWMQTGRRPSGVCGAALWVAALLHGYERSKRDVVAVVHVGEATLRKRVTEFENTKAATLSVDEFDAKAKEFEKEQAALADAHRGRPLAIANGGSNNSGGGSGSGMHLIISHATSLTCAHKDHESATHFAHGMCRACYLEYARVSGGAIGGEDPPAFQAAENKRAKEAAQVLGLPAPARNDLLPAPALLSAPALLGRGKKKLTATQIAEAIAAAARANAKHPGVGNAVGNLHDGSPATAASARAEAFLEEEMEKALDDSTSHLGEFAVLAGLRQKKGVSLSVGSGGNDQTADQNGFQLKGVGPEIADAAVALLKRLVGDAHASSFCLPLDRLTGKAKGSVTGKHLSSQHPHAKRDAVGVGKGQRILNTDKTQLHFLISAGCFDASAMARIRKFSKHDIDYMVRTSLPLRIPKRVTIATDPVAEAAVKAAAAKSAAASKAAADESNANHEKTRNAILKQNAREEKAAKRRADLLASQQSQARQGGLKGEDHDFETKKEETDRKKEKDPDGQDLSELDKSDSDLEPETFSDVDDDEIGNYIHTEEEVKLRRVIWSELNKEYLETQAAKEASTGGTGTAGGGQTQTGDRTEDGNTNNKKKRKQYTHTVPAESAAEAAHAMLSSKKISSKINYDALNDLFKQDSLDAAKRKAKEKGGGSGKGDGGKDFNAAPSTSGRRASIGIGAGRLSSRLTGFNPHGMNTEGGGDTEAREVSAEAGWARGSPRRARARRRRRRLKILRRNKKMEKRLPKNQNPKNQKTRSPPGKSDRCRMPRWPRRPCKAREGGPGSGDGAQKARTGCRSGLGLCNREIETHIKI